MKKRALGLRRIKKVGPREKENLTDNFPKVNIIIKADVVGSAEAILDVLETYNDDSHCRLSVVHYGVGTVNKTDIELAKAFDGNFFLFTYSIYIEDCIFLS